MGGIIWLYNNTKQKLKFHYSGGSDNPLGTATWTTPVLHNNDIRSWTELFNQSESPILYLDSKMENVIQHLSTPDKDEFFSSILFFVNIVNEDEIASIDSLDDSKRYNFQLYSNDKAFFSKFVPGINSPSNYEGWRKSVRTKNSFYQDIEPEGYKEIDYPQI